MHNYRINVNWIPKQSLVLLRQVILTQIKVIGVKSIWSLSVKHSWQAFKNLWITYLCMFDINLLRRCSLCSGISLVCTLKSLMILKSERILSVKPVKQDILNSRNFTEYMMFLWRTEHAAINNLFYKSRPSWSVFRRSVGFTHFRWDVH